ncbi:hypothetical protein BY996DRAFT_8492787 [Phakopsora pachyrhizi]|uniref:W2 domain-containing protein n=1 Tax=Phakopsora pachyrhizi TaxID=170000 RepID=A0AAV0BT20_PHAPC|nr:hypothetical protein BY996DRAFT_8492787 [Phakopsora pachyrhizi]CAH7689964.1 hypothetical protein PPACK8108_LOCUS25159 [Phakopsora pachyrhizi]
MSATTASKPSLAGVRNKQRKGVAKASAKFEPEEFRDQILKNLSTLKENDLDAVSAKLDALGNQLDYRKYEGPLFEILLVGGILAPGGSFVNDEAERSSFSILTSTQYPIDQNDMKRHVEVFNKLIRRYKYLQKLFEENALTGLLQYINKFQGPDLDKLSFALALFISTGLTSSNVLLTLQKEHLVKDGVSLNFVTKVFKAYLQVESPEHLYSSLRRGGVVDIYGFFPPQKRDYEDMSSFFKEHKLEPILAFAQKQRSGKIREETLSRLKEMVASEEPHEEIISFLQEQAQSGVIPDVDFITLVWEGLMHSLDMGSRSDQIVDMVVREVIAVAPILEAFCKNARTQISLINTIQVWAYENTKVMGAFARILKELYGHDVLSEQAILYWHSKGSKPQARQHFLKSTEPLVKFLKEQDDEDDDEEED